MYATLGSEAGLHFHHGKIFSLTAAPAMSNPMAKQSICDGYCKISHSACCDDFKEKGFYSDSTPSPSPLKKGPEVWKKILTKFCKTSQLHSEINTTSPFSPLFS